MIVIAQFHLPGMLLLILLVFLLAIIAFSLYFRNMKLERQIRQARSTRQLCEAAEVNPPDHNYSLLDGLANPVWVANQQADCIYFNKAWLDFRGCTLEQEANNGWIEGVHPEDKERCMTTYMEAFRQRSPFSMEYRLMHASGEFHWILDFGRPRFELDGLFAGYIGSCYDIHQRKWTEDELAREAAVNQALAALAQIFMSHNSLDDVTRHVLEQAMQLTSSQSGFTLLFGPQLEDDSFQIQSVWPAQPDEQLAGLVRMLSSGLAQQLKENPQAMILDHFAGEDRKEKQVKAGSAPKQSILLAPAITHGALAGMIVLYAAHQTFTRHHRSTIERLGTLFAVAIYEQQLKDRYIYMSMHDSLSGLHNRAYFDNQVKTLTVRGEYPVSIIVCDIDRLKRTNDTFGHAAGDKLVQTAAQILKASFREHDLIARIGGDEFGILLSNCPQSSVQEMLQRVRDRLAQQNEGKAASKVSLSLGAATAENPRALPAALIRADQVMYLEKDQKYSRCNQTPVLHPIET